MPEAPVLVRTEAAAAGHLGRLTLNSPGTLNALTLEMVDLLQEALDAKADGASVEALAQEQAATAKQVTAVVTGEDPHQEQMSAKLAATAAIGACASAPAAALSAAAA